ncbi:hypothetical protein TNCV_4217291 [Trichonephila clavipes]|nr:hypothetical protein TNCV_4217291 [Trichonephila clavipes]
MSKTSILSFVLILARHRSKLPDVQKSWCLRYDPERNDKACSGVLLSHLVGKRSEQKNPASKRSLPFLIVKSLSTRNFYPKERR